jgi:rare lipoprotein A (peptidoglycan hydrolase)
MGDLRPRCSRPRNRWLPFGTFLRVHYQDRCAIVLVNDRGPYGTSSAIDLSMAAGAVLSVGVPG